MRNPLDLIKRGALRLRGLFDSKGKHSRDVDSDNLLNTDCLRLVEEEGDDAVYFFPGDGSASRIPGNKGFVGDPPLVNHWRSGRTTKL